MNAMLRSVRVCYPRISIPITESLPRTSLCANIVEQASTMGTVLHLREDHPVALEFKSLRKSVATFQVRLRVPFIKQYFIVE
jgi:hypothetical protein